MGDEVRVLLLHGLLHLAGFDHEQDKGQMAAREAELRSELGLQGGLIERVARTKMQIQGSFAPLRMTAFVVAGANVPPALLRGRMST